MSETKTEIKWMVVCLQGHDQEPMTYDDMDKAAARAAALSKPNTKGNTAEKFQYPPYDVVPSNATWGYNHLQRSHGWEWTDEDGAEGFVETW